MRDDDNHPPDQSRQAGGVSGDHSKTEENIHFVHLGEREKANFRVGFDRTLQSIWDQAYEELKVAKTDRDVLQAPQKQGNPVSLMQHLSLNLRQAQEQGLCDKDFEIAAGTGGA